MMMTWRIFAKDIKFADIMVHFFGRNLETVSVVIFNFMRWPKIQIRKFGVFKLYKKFLIKRLRIVLDEI